MAKPKSKPRSKASTIQKKLGPVHPPVTPMPGNKAPGTPPQSNNK